MAITVNREVVWQKCGYNPHPRQLEFHNSNARFKIPVCGRRFGKALDVDTPILTHKGWKTMGTLASGDRVWGEDGYQKEVIATSDVMEDRRCYEVVFSDGNSIVADAEHLWFTWTHNARKSFRRRKGQVRNPENLPGVRTTEEIRATLTHGTRQDTNHSVPLPQPIGGHGRDLPLDPYVLGVWLGDGDQGAQITSADPEIMAEVEAAGFIVHLSEFTKYRYTVRGLFKKLSQMKLANKNTGIYNKHVPEEYLLADKARRLSLLQGLMDTDGTVSKGGSCCFDNQNEALADAVYFLVVSLGYKATRYRKAAKLNGRETGKTVHRVAFTPYDKVFRLQRKVERQKLAAVKWTQYHRYIVDVREVPSRPVRCIEIESDTGIFLAGHSLIPTHNSRMAAAEVTPLLMNPEVPVMGWIVGPGYADAENEFKYIWDDMAALGVLNMKGVKKAYNARIGEMYIELPWGSRVEAKSAGQPTRLVGKGLHFLVVSEAAKQQRVVWDKYLRPTLADHRGWAIFPSTPEGFNWFFDLYQEGQVPPEDQIQTECFGREGVVPTYASWNFPAWENHHVYPGGFDDPEVQSQLRSPEDPWFWQEIGASFRSVVGLVYPEWEDKLNIIDHYSYESSWDNYLWFDFGWANPFVALDVQISPSDDVYIWREYYVSEMPIHKHAHALRNRQQPDGYDIRCGFGDAADPEAVSVLSELLCPVYADPDSKDMSRGIAEVKRFLVGDEEDGPKLFVHRSCVNTIWEFQNYRMPEKKDSQNVKEKPRSYADHAMDAIRYGLMHLYVLGSGRYSMRDLMDIQEIPDRADSGIFTRSADSIFTMSDKGTQW